jgi:hypothetical protein
MKTFKYSTTAATPESSKYVTPVVDLLSANYSVKRYDSQEMLGVCLAISCASVEADFVSLTRYGAFIFSDDKNNAPTVEQIEYMQTAIDAGSYGIWKVDPTDIFADSLVKAVSYKFLAVLGNSISSANIASIHVEDLDVAQYLDHITVQPHENIDTIIIDFSETGRSCESESEIASVIHDYRTAFYYRSARFYYNSDSGHYPGDEDSILTVSVDIVIPVGTLISDEHGTRFKTLHEATIVSGTKSIEVDIYALDDHDLLASGSLIYYDSITGIDDIYVYNDEPIRRKRILASNGNDVFTDKDYLRSLSIKSDYCIQSVAFAMANSTIGDGYIRNELSPNWDWAYDVTEFSSTESHHEELISIEIDRSVIGLQYATISRGFLAFDTSNIGSSTNIISSDIY